MGIRLTSGNRGAVDVKLSDAALAARYAQEARTAAETAKAAAAHSPVIGGNGNWQIWNPGSGGYTDSGIRAEGPAGPPGTQGSPGNYTKPASGIPASDLSSAVQGSLGKADTAIRLGLTGAAVGDLVRVASVDANGKPTAWTHVPLGEIVTKKKLIDNWYFGPGVVNQRGISTASGTSKYIVDRWTGYGYTAATLSIGAAGLSIENNASGTQAVRQFLRAPLPSGTYTLSAIVVSVSGDGNIGTLTARSGNTKKASQSFAAAGLAVLTFLTDGTTDPITNVGFSCGAGKSVTVLAMGLEPGDSQSLAHQENGVWVLNELPDSGEELLKCQRYFQIFRTQALRPTYRQDYRPEMAANPQSGATDVNQPTLDTITIDGTTYYTASAES